MLFSPHLNVKMPTIVGILTFMSRKNFMLSWIEHEKSFITSRPNLGRICSFGLLGLLCASLVNVYQFVCVHFDFEGKVGDLIVLIS